MTTIELDPEVIEVDEPELIVGSAGGSGDGLWEAWITDLHGTRLATLDAANLRPIDQRLNDMWTTSVEIPKGVAAATEMHRITREVQIARSGRVIMSGPIVGRQATSAPNSPGRTFPVNDVRWYLTRQLRGGAQPWSRNYITNYRFDDGFDRWILTGTGITLDGDSETGTDSMLLADGTATSIAQSVLIDIALKYQVVIEARVKVATGATTGRGLEVEIPGVGGGDSWKVAEVTADTPRDAWTSLTATLNVDGRVGARTLTARIHGVDDGDLRVDRVLVTIFPITSLTESVGPPITQVDIAQEFIDAIIATGRDFNIGVRAEPTGQLIDHTPDEWIDTYVDDLIELWVKRDPGIDWGFEYTPTTRTAVAYFPHQGRDITSDVVTLRLKPAGGDPVNTARYDLDENAVEAVSEVTTKGAGGFRGVFQDPTAWGGMRLQLVQEADEKTPIADLEGLSRKAIRASIGDVRALTALVTDGTLIDLIRLGDRVLVIVDDEDVQINEIYRVVGIELDPKTDNMKLTLNVWPS